MQIQHMWIAKKLLFFLVITGCCIASCTTLDVYEKTQTLTQHEWKSTNPITTSFDITDTTSSYNMFVVIRHGDAYKYRNIWLDIQVKAPDTSFTIKREFSLSDNTKWTGTAIDDIVEHRMSFNNAPVRLKKGNYTFRLQHVMREDPLYNVYNVGVRVEKATK